MPTRQEIEFTGESGATLRGWYFLPDGTGESRVPAISMCHGYAAIREHGLEPYAQAFARAGFAVLVHDHHGFGASDGEPRQDIDPWLQIADWRRALSYLERRPEVDAQRLGIWGTSYSGGHALVLGATDRRVRCVVSQVPTISGFEQGRRRVSPDVAPAFVETLTEDLRAQHRGEAPRYQAIVDADPARPAAYRSPDAVAFYTRDLCEARWSNTVTLRSTHAARMYEPGLWVGRVSPTPLMMIVAQDDRLTMTDLELQAYERALQPKRLVLLPGGHFDPYDKYFSLSSGAAVEWFVDHLAAR
ncbi:alpha/beta hydrolase [Bordetella genomosp. 8]|uniref:Alpha/beta hydrolase n=1 Tax=Bordetella genomosp. 8 TaxID=1416806 RepID=A0A1W6YG85_9BORD|nr:alpha/beta hydrolase [Bordetella genomosp. 8]ARP80061.1 alpha/beta hydrolase [Bordetella genomosp. 8]